MQSRLFAKKVIKMSARGSILEAFGGHFGPLWVPNGTSEAFFERSNFWWQKSHAGRPGEPGAGGPDLWPGPKKP